MKVAIFPGSFDPIHRGHIALAQTAADALNLDRVIFVPSGVSPNKRSRQRTPGTIRHGWIQKALQGLSDPRLVASDFESRHNVPTYTYETLAALTRENRAGREEAYVLMGADTVERMKRWPTYGKILRIVQIASFGREGLSGNIEAPTWPHSSTEVRTRIARGQKIDHLVPKEIVTDLTKHFGTPNIR
jgi:nicotinate-nucleotide adenylyltransferase